MNVVFLSPNFPPNFRHFSLRLKEVGAVPLGIGDASWETLPEDLRGALAEYYKVESLEDYDKVHRAVGHLIHKHGRIERIESLNEHWIETECRLRTDFNVPGPKVDALDAIKRKSRMKEIFAASGLAVAPGALVDSLEAARAHASAWGYPVVLKPDKGVGASETYRADDEAQLVALAGKIESGGFFLEKFVRGDIYSFDGLANADGVPVFHSSLRYLDPVMDLVNEARHTAFYTLREIPDDLLRAGLATLRAFDVRERFFHFEFFRTPEGGIVALEVNLRPPGGLIMDMMNFANDIDLYREWALLLKERRFDAAFHRKYHCAFASRRDRIAYRLGHDEVMARHGALVCHSQAVEPAFRGAMGDFVYLLRDPDLERLMSAVRDIHEIR